MPLTSRNQKNALNGKKKPPPRPPPPNFSKYKSKSTYNLLQQNQSVNLIEWSPPNSPKPERNQHFGGSVSSSFSSSTSSLASSKKSFELETPTSNNIWPIQNSQNSSAQNNGPTFQSYVPLDSAIKQGSLNVPSLFGPTIIRPQSSKKITKVINGKVTPPSPTLPMPSIPPPSPPKIEADVDTPYGIALYDYQPTHPTDLALQPNDVIVLLRRINDEWLYGKVFDKEGMFPENFIDIKVPLKEEDNIVTALYEFEPQMAGDLGLKPGQKIKVTSKISDEWLYGVSETGEGQFPSNFINRIPKGL